MAEILSARSVEALTRFPKVAFAEARPYTSVQNDGTRAEAEGASGKRRHVSIR